MTATMKSNAATNTQYKNRTDEVISALIDAVRGVIREKGVTYEEYRAAVGVLNQYNGAAPYEVNLVCDMFFEQAVHDEEMKHLKSSITVLKGPYFLEGAPEVTDSLKTIPGQGEPFKVRMSIKDTQGNPIEGVVVDVWHANPEGTYSGYFDDFPIDYFRGKVTTDTAGQFSLKTTKPKEYAIPMGGPTGKILSAMERSEWRPAHVHFMCKKPGYLTHITQSYFEDHSFIDGDVVDGVRPEVIYKVKDEGDYQAIDIEIVMQREDE